MLVKDVMTCGVIVVQPHTPLVTAARQMRAHNVGCLPVVEGGEVLGMLTDNDIVLRIVAEGLDVNRALVREAMSPRAVACSCRQTVEEARAMMHANHLKHLPVLDRRGRLVGLLAFRDIAEDVAKCRPRRVTFYKQVTSSFGQRRDVALGTIFLPPALEREQAVDAAIDMFEREHGVTPWHHLADRYALDELA